MKALEILIRGILAGLIISAPVGPVNILCVSRTLSKGRKAGVISGLGAATADTIYGAIAGFSIRLVIGFLLREEFWIRLLGGIFLIGLGVRYYFKRPPSLAAQSQESAGSDYVSTFLLNLTNPTTVLSFLAVLAGLGLAQRRPWPLTLILILGLFCGSMLWWITLAVTANHFRDRFNDRAVVWMNRVAGLAIGGFGIVTLLLARFHQK